MAAGQRQLPVTYEHFHEYGIHGHEIGPGIRECIALGFLEITERGRAGNSEFRAPNLFRLTYRPTRVEGPTDDWRHIETFDSARVDARAARLAQLREHDRAHGVGRCRLWGRDKKTSAQGEFLSF